MPQKAPALFIGHGSPMNAIEDTTFSRGWAQIAQRFPKPRAVVVISAHWITEGVRVMANAHPRTIHDFGRSFPQALFDVQYPAPGDPALARQVVDKLQPFGAELDDSWGLDHGAWSVLVHMYPDADVPIIQVSLDARRQPREHYNIARALASLRDEGVMILGSGNIVHNLRAFFQNQPIVGAEAFDEFIVSHIEAGDDASVISYHQHPDARSAAPDWDHFFPVLYPLGARAPGERATFFNREGGPGIAMTSFAFGISA
jgi:4,5-DOPA dioxygenase extradiol